MKKILKNLTRLLPLTNLIRVEELRLLPAGVRHFAMYRLQERRDDKLLNQRTQYRYPRYFSDTGSLDSLETLSLDFYDTLFARRVSHPTAISAYLGHVLAQRGLILDANSFAPARRAAELMARSKSIDKDISINEIYNSLEDVCSWGKDVRDIAIKLEISIEENVLVPRAAILEIMRSAKIIGTKIIIISDTYMDESFIQSVLKRHQVDNVVDAIYCSSDVGFRKDTGTMWSWLLENNKISSNAFLHVGDNAHSDEIQPHHAGLPALGIVNTTELAEMRGYPISSRWCYGHSDWRSSLLLGPAIAAIGNDPEEQGNFQPLHCRTSTEFGYLVLGPLIFTFISWLIQRARENNVEELFFLSRDGYFLKKIYEDIVVVTKSVKLPSSKYLFVSRRAVLPAAMHQTVDSDLLIGNGSYQGSVSNFFHVRLGLSVDRFLDARMANQEIRLPKDRSMLSSILQKYRHVIAEDCKTASENLSTYLLTSGFLFGPEQAIVDLGYSGTIQRCLQSHAGLGTQGFYLMTTPAVRNVETLGGLAHTCFDKRYDPVMPQPVNRGHLALEAIFAAPHGQVEGYLCRDGIVSPSYRPEPDTGTRFCELEMVANGISNYCTDMVNTFGSEVLYVDMPIDTAQAPFAEFLAGRIKPPSVLLQALVLEDNFSGKGLRQSFM